MAIISVGFCLNCTGNAGPFQKRITCGKNKKMNKKLVQLVETGVLDEPIKKAARKLLDKGNNNKMCRCTVHTGSTDITMIIRRPFWSGFGVKSCVFEITMWISHFIREAGGRLKRITEIHKYERSISIGPIIPYLSLN